MKTSLVLLLVVLAPAWGVVLKDDAKPSTYDELICQLQNGSPSVCVKAEKYKPESGTGQKCSDDGLICSEESGFKGPVGNVGQKSREACLRSSKIDKATECPPLKIVPGKNIAVAEQFPHMAAVGYTNKSETVWLCSGVLISEKFVLTTATCALSLRSKNDVVKIVRLGDLDIKYRRFDPNIQEIEVEKVIPNPLFNQPSLYHDIALLKLVSDTKFSARVRPACLNAFPQLPVTKVIATGFGGYFGNPAYGILRYADLNEGSPSVCNKLLTEGLEIYLKDGVNHSSMCVFGEGRDICNGDGGGALQIRLDEPYCQFSVVGIPSLGFGQCGSLPKPSIFTRVSEYLQWIESIVWS